MNTTVTEAPAGLDRFDHAERLLARYPDISSAETDDLKRWFKKEASAFEIATLAGKEDVNPGYTAFRAQHIDAFSVREMIGVALFLLLLGCGIWLAL